MTARSLPDGSWACRCPGDRRWHCPGDVVCRRCHDVRPDGNAPNPTNLPPPTQNTGGRRSPEPASSPANAPRPAKRRPRGPNRIESLYNSVHLDGKGVFEGLPFRIASDDEKVHRYKPDWIADQHGRIVIVEVKDARRHHHSHQRSRLAFDSARKEWAWLRARWIWAEWDGKKFDEEVYDTLGNNQPKGNAT